MKSGSPKGDGTNKKSYYCSEHGKNPMQATIDCYTIKNRDKRVRRVLIGAFPTNRFAKKLIF